MYAKAQNIPAVDTLVELTPFSPLCVAETAPSAAPERAGWLPREADYGSMLRTLNHFLVIRDAEVEGHSERVARLAVEFAGWLKLTESEIEIVRRGALMHDLGKLGVPDYILQKRGPLTDEEWVIMRQHPEFAYDLLAAIPYFEKALDIPYCHHERWDGAGYPRGLAGEQIPFTARLFSLIDVWDALLSVRSYKAAWTPQQAREYIAGQSGKQFDPRLTTAFLDMLDWRARKGTRVM